MVFFFRYENSSIKCLKMIGILFPLISKEQMTFKWDHRRQRKRRWLLKTIEYN